jgi:hypothetical protein
VSARRVWTEDEVFALGVKCTVEQAGSILGLGGKEKAYRLLHAGEFPMPTFEMNDQTWVQTRPIRELLGIEPKCHCQSNGHHKLQDFTVGSSPAEVPPAVKTGEADPAWSASPSSPNLHPAKGEVRVNHSNRPAST